MYFYRNNDGTIIYTTLLPVGCPNGAKRSDWIGLASVIIRRETTSATLGITQQHHFRSATTNVEDRRNLLGLPRAVIIHRETAGAHITRRKTVSTLFANVRQWSAKTGMLERYSINNPALTSPTSVRMASAISGLLTPLVVRVLHVTRCVNLFTCRLQLL